MWIEFMKRNKDKVKQVVSACLNGNTKVLRRILPLYHKYLNPNNLQETINVGVKVYGKCHHFTVCIQDHGTDDGEYLDDLASRCEKCAESAQEVDLEWFLRTKKLINVAVLSSKPDIVKMVLRDNLYLKLESRNESPLQYLSWLKGSENDLKEIVRLLCDNGYSLDFVDFDGYTLLHAACHVGINPIAVKVLVEAGTNIDRETTLGRTPLGIACIFSDTNIIEYLLQNGANISFRGDKICFVRAMLHVQKLLLFYGLNLSALFRNRLLLNFLCDLPVHKKIDIVNFLIESGRKFNEKELQRIGYIPKASEMKKMSEYRLDLHKMVIPLQRLSANVIRRSLQHNHCPPNLYPKVMKLEDLPNLLKKYILFR